VSREGLHQQFSVVSCCDKIKLKKGVSIMSRSHHVVPNPNGGWDVKVSGGQKTIKHTETKNEAIGVARKISANQDTELVIHNKDGQISQKDSHGNDPCPPKGLLAVSCG
jgi:hypothetical protein